MQIHSLDVTFRLAFQLRAFSVSIHFWEDLSPIFLINPFYMFHGFLTQKKITKDTKDCSTEYSAEFICYTILRFKIFCTNFFLLFFQIEEKW